MQGPKSLIDYLAIFLILAACVVTAVISTLTVLRTHSAMTIIYAIIIATATISFSVYHAVLFWRARQELLESMARHQEYMDSIYNPDGTLKDDNR